MPIIIVGTKSDLADERKVSYRDLANFADESKGKHSVVDYFEVSALDQYKNSINVLFEAVARHAAALPETEIRHGSFKL